MFTDNVNDPATIVYPIIVLINIDSSGSIIFIMDFSNRIFIQINVKIFNNSNIFTKYFNSVIQIYLTIACYTPMHLLICTSFHASVFHFL